MTEQTNHKIILPLVSAIYLAHLLRNRPLPWSVSDTTPLSWREKSLLPLDVVILWIQDLHLVLQLQLLLVEDLAAKSKTKIIVLKSFLYIFIQFCSSISSIAEHQGHSAIEFVIDASVTSCFLTAEELFQSKLFSLEEGWSIVLL